MTARVALLSVALGLALGGCVSYYEQTPLDLKPVPVPEGRERALVIGIREPRVRLDPPLIRGTTGETYAIETEVERSVALIRALRASGLYRAVDFESQLACAPNVVLQIHVPPYLHEDNPLFVVGILFSSSTNIGHYFSRVDAPDTRFAFPFWRTVNAGGTAALFALLPGVTRVRTNTNLDASFRAYLLAHEAELMAGVTPDSDRACGS